MNTWGDITGTATNVIIVLAFLKFLYVQHKSWRGLISEGKAALEKNTKAIDKLSQKIDDSH